MVTSLQAVVHCLIKQDDKFAINYILGQIIVYHLFEQPQWDSYLLPQYSQQICYQIYSLAILIFFYNFCTIFLFSWYE